MRKGGRRVMGEGGESISLKMNRVHSYIHLFF